MSLPIAAPLRRVLDRLADVAAPLPLPELARALLALRTPVDAALARRLLAAALGCRAELLPEVLDVRDLPRLVHGPVAGLPLERAVLVVVDLETTGLSAERATILEFGAVRLEGLRPVDRFQTLVDPGVPVPETITALTGIDRQLLDGAPVLARAVRDFHAWAGAATGAVFVAHNASFDARFVARAFASHGLPPWAGPVLCTRRLARRLLPELGRYSLDAVCARFGIANAWRHRALGDAEATARALCEMLEIGSAEHGLQSVGDLLEIQAMRPARLRRGRLGRRRPAIAS